MNDNKKILELLKKLSTIGELHFNKESRSRTGELNYSAVGLAIASVTSRAEDLAHIAYAGLEDWNYHNICAVLGYIFPALYPEPAGAPAEEWLSNLRHIEAEFNKRGEMNVYTDWNADTSSYNVEKYRLRVVIEKM